MKVKIIEEGYFKNPEQMKADAEKRKEIGDAEVIAKIATNTIINPIVNDLIANADSELNIFLRDCLGTVVEKALLLSSSNNAFTWRYYNPVYRDNDLTSKGYPLEKFVKPAAQKIASSCPMLCKLMGPGIWKQENISGKTVGEFYGVASASGNGQNTELYKKVFKSCKRVAALPVYGYLTDRAAEVIEKWEGIKDVEKTGAYLLFEGSSVCDISIYFIVTGFDFDDKGEEEYYDVVKTMITSENDPIVKNYFQKAVAECHITAAGLRTEFNKLAEILEDFIASIIVFMKKKDPTPIPEDLVRTTIKSRCPVKITGTICRACEFEGASDIIPNVGENITNKQYIDQLDQFGNLHVQYKMNISEESAGGLCPVTGYEKI